ncbi:uncharacterized protein LOC125226551 [Leguminivora glycinivorella]|uniref:uncharacterized protein LOC125226551 n=1 Tax=Leguminivora glycinivorella TaxID=1035111 RepID=UPI00200F53A0|nr:uncharacterized protein LOC125226551 [Leguminivora glycinivorella]XP_047986502.1 uncharacterized protein LOC125226551 [Leguminivora glycinivorella]
MIFFEGFQNNHLLQPRLRREAPAPQADNSGSQCVKFNIDDVSSLHKRQTTSAKHLCIYDISTKLQKYSEYEIGGTFTDNEPDLWFYFNTSYCPGNKCLLNLFVCLRKVGSFSIGISKSPEVTHDVTGVTGNSPGRSYLPYDFKWQAFKSNQPDEKYFVKTYCLTPKDLEGKILCIPIAIKTDSASPFNMDLIKQIKLNHDFGELLSKQEKTNFVVESASRKQYHVHKIILAAHSPLLRNKVKNETDTSLFLDISDNDMELLLQFLYTGTIKDILRQDCINLLDIAGKFELGNLFFLVQYAIAEQINVANCMEIAVISERYKLEKLQTTVFQFIKENPQVYETEGWNNLNDINLTKKMFQYVNTKKSTYFDY